MVVNERLDDMVVFVLEKEMKCWYEDEGRVRGWSEEKLND